MTARLAWNVAADVIETIVFPAVDQHLVQAALFAKAILVGTQPRVQPSDAIADLRIIDGILAANGTQVLITDP